MEIEPLLDDLGSASSSQQQLTVDSYGLSSPLFLAQPTTTGASTYLHAAATSPGLCNFNSSLGQNQFQIAAGGSSPEHRQIRSNDALHYISQMLMEDVDETPVGVCQEEAALQAAEKPFRDILGPVCPPATNWPPLHSNNETGDFHNSWTSRYKRLWSASFSNDNYSYSMLQPLTNPLSPYTGSVQKRPFISVGLTSRSGFPALHRQRGVKEATMAAPSIDKLVIYLENGILSITKLTTNAKVGERSENAIFEVADPSDPSENWDILEGRSNKHLAFTTCAIIRNENFDRILLCYGRKSFEQITRSRRGMAEEGNKSSMKGRSKGHQKLWQRKQPRRELVDLRTLLVNCAQAVAEHDHLVASELLKKIRQHSSADGGCTQRLAFYLADGLEARLAGIGSQVYRNLMERRTSTTDWLDACSHFHASCPFDRTSHYFASQAILGVSQGQPRVHIVDFGIGFGLQWPLMIQRFSQQEEGAPKLRITGIDIPQPGLHPCEMIEETGKRLADYANMFKVPFQYQGIAASRWETIKIEDLNIDEDEVLIINCMFRMKNLGHETEAVNSRDKVLKTMRRMKPKIFILGTVNGLSCSPFFIQRFKEVMFHYSSLFDMLDANFPPWDNKARKMIEKILFGQDALNIIACEGAERTERPESYRQWQARCLKAGFQPLPVDPAILKNIVQMKNKLSHEEFFVVEDRGWLLQGWKGRVLYAISKWKPNETYDDK
ncbi:scarecrow-like protein 30 [Triticum urartu]|uniref:scarecrow-like protein 30 n=1 Tax=Triticum urartu TaxID=4572 RepID=UPI00204431A6|nr:scarecrow-like protein 30 [Triticum urartu]